MPEHVRDQIQDLVIPGQVYYGDRRTTGRNVPLTFP
jgi:hypothetical protein